MRTWHVGVLSRWFFAKIFWGQWALDKSLMLRVFEVRRATIMVVLRAVVLFSGICWMRISCLFGFESGEARLLS